MTTVVGALALAATSAFFFAIGLDEASRWAAPLGILLGVAALALAGYSAVLTRRSVSGTATGGPPAAGTMTHPEGGTVTNTISGGTFLGGAPIQGRDITVTPSAGRHDGGEGTPGRGEPA
ncbi:hypothetical protein MRQ36_26235 [Micromonospora sp. R77]|uniref:hypothetical protein n=1 Tax=Micromonospora sp. R77 TaxID=2925836 RepID=UPI001F60FBCC|nr:hypothetical protein [Micromonospora sp. R77]MCI4065859.1 hypothetical protein [Micromonospora sp. R77]